MFDHHHGRRRGSTSHAADAPRASVVARSPRTSPGWLPNVVGSTSVPGRTGSGMQFAHLKARSCRPLPISVAKNLWWPRRPSRISFSAWRSTPAQPPLPNWCCGSRTCMAFSNQGRGPIRTDPAGIQNHRGTGRSAYMESSIELDWLWITLFQGNGNRREAADAFLVTSGSGPGYRLVWSLSCKGPLGRTSDTTMNRSPERVLPGGLPRSRGTG